MPQMILLKVKGAQRTGYRIYTELRLTK